MHGWLLCFRQGMPGKFFGSENSISKSHPPLLSAKSTTFAESIRADALVQTVSPGKCAIGMTVPGQHIYKHKIMSDGNFNRALLPSTPYRSGIKMGQQQLRIKAEAAFREVVKEKFPTLSDEELDNISEEFHKKLL